METQFNLNSRIMLKAKLHQAYVTHAELEYEGSCSIDGVLLDAADICEYEQIQIYNLANGNRFTTYAIRAEDNSGIICVNGAAAHLASPGDRVIVCTYANYQIDAKGDYKPNVLYIGKGNTIKSVKQAIPV
jgi:aspartate 1-decarboxylase